MLVEKLQKRYIIQIDCGFHSSSDCFEMPIFFKWQGSQGANTLFCSQTSALPMIESLPTSENLPKSEFLPSL